MDDQLDLFLERTGEQLRDEAMNQVERHAGEDWKEDAFNIVYAIALKNEFFTADDYHEAARRTDLPNPPDNRAWGPVLLSAIREGICEPTGRWRKTQRSVRHAAPTRIYRSLVWNY